MQGQIKNLTCSVVLGDGADALQLQGGRGGEAGLHGIDPTESIFAGCYVFQTYLATQREQDH